jgi:hypothetical protein
MVLSQSMGHLMFSLTAAAAGPEPKLKRLNPSL